MSGMMLVGPAGGGKSRVNRALQMAMSRVTDEPGFDKVRVYKLKCVKSPFSLRTLRLSPFNLLKGTPCALRVSISNLLRTHVRIPSFQVRSQSL